MALQEMEERISAVKIQLERLEKHKAILLNHLIYMELVSAALFDEPDMN